MLTHLNLWQVVLNLGSLQNSHEGRISCLGLSADGSALCTGSWDTNLKVGTLYTHVSCLCKKRKIIPWLQNTRGTSLVIFLTHYQSGIETSGYIASLFVLNETTYRQSIGS